MVNAKGFAKSGLAFLLIGFSLVSCSKQNEDASPSNPTPTVESYPISAGELKNCRFQNPNPTYTFGAPIAPNPILCDEGVAMDVQLLTPGTLPTGLQFSKGQLSLVGTASEKVVKAPYDFYIENASGYLRVKIQITVQ